MGNETVTTPTSTQDPSMAAGTAVLSASPTEPTPAPPASISTPGTAVLSASPTAPVPAPAPGSFQDKLSQAIGVIGNHPNAPAVMAKPGGWARAMLGGVMSALSKTGENIAEHGGIGSYFPGSENSQGPLGSLVGALRQQSNAAQAARDKATKDRQEQETHDVQIQKDKAQIASANAQKIHAEQVFHLTGEAAVDKDIAEGKKMIEEMTAQEGLPAQILQEGIKADDIPQAIIDHTFKSTEDTAIPSGKVDTGKKYEDGRPIYETTYTLVHVPATKIVSKADAEQLSKDLKMTITEGQELSGADWIKLKQMQHTQNAATEMRNKVLVEAGLATQAEAEKMEKANLKPIFNSAVADSMRKGTDITDAPIAALKTLQLKAAQDPEFAKKYPNLEADVKEAYGEKNWDALLVEHQKHKDEMTLEAQKEFNKNKGKPADIPNPNNLHGEDFLRLLPAGEGAAVRGVVQGKITLSQRQMQTKDGQRIVGEVMEAYPDFDISKAASYGKAREAFTSGDPAKGINQSNTVLHHLNLMEGALNNATAGLTGRVEKFLGGNEAGRTLTNSALAVANELGKLYSGGVVTEGEKHEWLEKLSPDSMGMTVNKLRSNLKDFTKLLGGKLEAYQDQWDDARPSKSIEAPKAIASQESLETYRRIVGQDMKVRPTGGGVPQPEAQAQPGQPTAQPQFAVGQDIVQNGVHMKVTSVDQYGHVTGAE